MKILHVVTLLAFAATARGQCDGLLLPSGQCLDVPGAPRIPKKFEPAQVRPCPFDVTFVIDESGSVSAPNYDSIKAFIKAVIQTFASADISETGTHFGVNSFSLDTTDQFALGAATTLAGYVALIDAIERSPGSGPGDITGTCITCGIKRALERQLEHDASEPADHATDRTKVIMVITDGRHNAQGPDPKSQADLARENGIAMFAIGVGTQTDLAELNSIANEPSETFSWQILDFAQLETLGALLGVGLECGEPLPPTPSPTPPPTPSPAPSPTPSPVILE